MTPISRITISLVKADFDPEKAICPDDEQFKFIEREQKRKLLIKWARARGYKITGMDLARFFNKVRGGRNAE